MSDREVRTAPATVRTETLPLGDVEPARSRHAGRRSAVCLAEDLIVVGDADGTVRGVDRETLGERFAVDGPGSVVALTPFAGGIAAGERGPDGGVRLLDDDGTTIRRYETATDVGGPARESRFYLPFVAALATDGETLFAAARRYERDGDDRTFESSVYAFAPDGTVRWRYAVDASPIALSARDGRVAVAYNRCPGEHRDGMVVLDAEQGSERWAWDPPGDSQRRVGDVSLLSEGAAVASHADYRGYRVDRDGVRWSTALATPAQVGDERLYAYPNHVHATDSGVAFVTGNTYPTEGRETERVHPDAHAVFGYTPDGERRWRADHGGFAGGVAGDGDRLVVPAAQAFRVRDESEHGGFVAELREGPLDTWSTEGVLTAVAADDGTVAGVEEPVVYHDEGVRYGTYRVHVRR
jgi:outer membrane protein assembly factor BamB